MMINACAAASQKIKILDSYEFEILGKKSSPIEHEQLAEEEPLLPLIPVEVEKPIEEQLPPPSVEQPVLEHLPPVKVDWFGKWWVWLLIGLFVGGVFVWMVS